jgi:hypothetical protein
MSTTKRTSGRKPGKLKEKLPKRSETEMTSPSSEEEALVTALDACADPYKSLATVAAEAGIPESAIKRLVDRIKSKFQPVISEMKTVQTSELTRMLDDRAYRALSYLDDFALSAASAKDLAIVAGIMLEKRQLLRGEPTHILSQTERASMNELGQMLMKELSRRKIDVYENADYIEVSEGETPVRLRKYRPRGSEIELARKAIANDAVGEP